MSPSEFTNRLQLYDSNIIVPVSVFDAGLHKYRVATSGNSILSTLWVKSIDVGATVKARWYDIGPGNGDFPGEKIPLGEHDLISTDDKSDRRIIAKLHNKAFVEIEVIGGQAEFGIYITVVSSFPNTGLLIDGQDGVLTSDGGGAISIYDQAANKFYLARGTLGVADVNIVGGSLFLCPPGTGFVKQNKIETDGNLQTLIDETVPTGKIWRLVSVKFLSRCHGEGDILIAGSSIDGALTGPAENNVICEQMPYKEIAAGQKLEVKFKRNFGASSADIRVIATLTTIDV